MASNASPKYPRRESVLKKRLLSQAALLLLAVGGALFYVFIHNAAPEDDALTALDRLAASFSQGAAPSPASPAHEEGAAALPVASQELPTTEQSAPSLLPEAAATGEAEGKPSPRKETRPFAGQSLDEIAAELSSRYAKILPTRWDERMPGITSSLLQPGGAGAALWKPTVLAVTLDACGGRKGESYDAGIIEYLRKHKIPATIFVTSVWIKNNADNLKDLAADPLFEIAAHGARHKPASVTGRSVYGITGTASIDELVREVEGNARDIEAATGKRPRWYRSGTAYYDDVAVSIVEDLGLGVAGYSIACDEGATLSSARVTAKTLAARHGDILLLHLNKPRGGTREGLLEALPQLVQRGARFVRLSEAPDGENGR